MSGLYRWQKLQSDFDKVIAYSQKDIPEVNSEKMLKKWEQQKNYFLERFGGPIYNAGEIKITLDPVERYTLFSEFLEKVYYRKGLYEFLRDRENDFFNNKLSEPYQNIPAGIKMIRAFKYFIEDPAELRKLQDLASQYIQKNEIIGDLCVSVHPLDFLSISENNCNWRSCHSLDGDYRAGNLSYMLDTSTVVCYLKEKEEMQLPAFPKDVKWNSKKWRVLFYLSEDKNMLFASKQYPFNSQNALNKALEIYQYATNLPGFSSWKNKYIKDEDLLGDFIPYKGHPISLRNMFFHRSNELLFNDVIRSSVYNAPYYTFRYSGYFTSKPEFPMFIVGEEVECLHCNSELITVPCTCMCDQCEIAYGTETNDFFDNCDECGKRDYSDNFVRIQDNILCEKCADDLTTACSCCGEVYFTECLNYNSDTEEYICNYCKEN